MLSFSLGPLFPSFPESISYVPQISNHTLEGRLTQSTFTLEQPLGQFENVSLSDLDSVWLVVAHSHGTYVCFLTVKWVQSWGLRAIADLGVGW